MQCFIEAAVWRIYILKKNSQWMCIPEIFFIFASISAFTVCETSLRIMALPKMGISGEHPWRFKGGNDLKGLCARNCGFYFYAAVWVKETNLLYHIEGLESAKNCIATTVTCRILHW